MEIYDATAEGENKMEGSSFFQKTPPGVLIYYNPNPKNLDLNGELGQSRRKQNLVAFVVGFQWWHGTSDDAEVRILRSNSKLFTKLGANGDVLATTSSDT